MNQTVLKTGITENLYEDAYRKECLACVVSCKEREVQTDVGMKKRYAVVLDKTVFFPEGGGQGSDKGFLNDVPVVDVQREDGILYHYTEEPLKEGTQVKACIDFTLRYKKMQNHSGEHLICGLIHKLYGYDNVGFHMSENFVTVDVNGVLKKEDVQKLERMANDVIDENVPIRVVFPDSPDEMEYRSKLELTEDIRVVIIEGYDACACCAPHVARTGEIGLLKVIDFMSHRGGTRFTLKCGSFAREDYALLQEETEQIMRLFSAGREECDKAAERVSRQLRTQQETITALKKQITALYVEKLRAAAGTSSDMELIFEENLDDIQLRSLINEGVTLLPGVVAGFLGKDEEGYRYIIGKAETAEKPDLRQLAKDMNVALNGRGGGSVKMIQGSVNAKKKEIEGYLKAYGK